MYCESCGSFIPDGQSFCTNCGTPVSTPVAQPAAAPAPAPAPVAAPVVAAAPAPQPVQPVYQQPQAQPVQPVYQQPQAQPVQPVYQQPVYQPQAQPVQPVYQQPVYQQPAQQPVYQQVAQAPAKRPNGPATAGLVFGILTFVFCGIPFLFWGLGLFGLIFSIVGLAKKNAKGKGKAIAGLILTVLGIIIGIIIQETFWTMVGKELENDWDEMLSTLYDTNYSGNDADNFYIDGDFVNTDDGYVTGNLHIDGYRVDF